MDEVRRIVKPGGNYYYKTIMRARLKMEEEYYKNFDKKYRDMLENSGEIRPYRAEVSLDNPQFYSLDLRFDVDIPDRFFTMATSSASSQHKEKNNESEEESSVSPSKLNSTITTDSTLSSINTEEKDTSTIESTVDDGNTHNKGSSKRHSPEIDESSRSSLEEGEIDSDVDDDADDSLDHSDYSAEDVDNETYRNSKKRKLDDLQNRNVVGCKTYSFSLDNETTLEKMECLQCELCGKMETCESGMKEHLRSAEHFAASEVCGTFNNGVINTIEVVKESCVKNQNALYKTIVPICPVCHDVFSTIYVCAMHFRIVHDFSVKDCYSVGKVTREETITNINNDACSKCNLTFSKSAQLKQHWESSLHFPYSAPTGNEVVIFICPACHLKSNNFLNVANHIQVKHLYGNSKNKHILVRYIKKSSNFLKVLPSIPVSTEEQKRRDSKKISELGINITKKSVGGNILKFLKDFGGKRLVRKLERRKKTKKRLKINKSAVTG